MGKKQSPARRARREAQRAAQQAEQAVERPLKAVPAPEPVEEEGGLRLAEDLDFMSPPLDLLLAEGVVSASRPKTVDLGPALEAHWGKFIMANPDLKVFSKTVRALVRVLIREYEAAAEVAREEMRRTRVPARPEVGPLLQAVRAERRLIKAEESGDIFDED